MINLISSHSSPIYSLQVCHVVPHRITYELVYTILLITLTFWNSKKKRINMKKRKRAFGTHNTNNVTEKDSFEMITVTSKCISSFSYLAHLLIHMLERKTVWMTVSLIVYSPWISKKCSAWRRTTMDQEERGNSLNWKSINIKTDSSMNKLTYFRRISLSLSFSSNSVKCGRMNTWRLTLIITAHRWWEWKSTDLSKVNSL